MDIQIIYYSKYGSTKEIAHAIGKKLHTDNISDIMDLNEITGDLVVVGSPIYSEIPYADIIHLLRDEERKLKDKEIAIFVVCMRKGLVKLGDKESGGPVYLRKMEEALGRPPIVSKIFGGRRIMAELDCEDQKRIEAFSKRLGREFNDEDIMSLEEVDEFIRDIKTKMNLEQKLHNQKGCSNEGI